MKWGVQHSAITNDVASSCERSIRTLRAWCPQASLAGRSKRFICGAAPSCVDGPELR
jgi:hypothetical protein